MEGDYSHDSRFPLPIPVSARTCNAKRGGCGFDTFMGGGYCLNRQCGFKANFYGQTPEQQQQNQWWRQSGWSSHDDWDTKGHTPKKGDGHD